MFLLLFASVYKDLNSVQVMLNKSSECFFFQNHLHAVQISKKPVHTKINNKLSVDRWFWFYPLDMYDVHICMHGSIQACTPRLTHTHTHSYTQSQTTVCTHTCMHLCNTFFILYIHIWICTCMCVNTHADKYFQTLKHTYMSIEACTHMHTHSVIHCRCVDKSKEDGIYLQTF